MSELHFFTYVLYSESTNQFYKGNTGHIESCVSRHNRGKESYSKDGTPWNLVWFIEKPTLSEAKKLEAKLMNLSQIRLVRFMLRYEEGIQGEEAQLFLSKFIR